MYGLVNKAIEDLITERFGEETWERIRSRADVAPGGFVSMDPYPDQITFDLVAAAAAELQTEAGELLAEFGRYWILYTANEGYGDLLDLSGSSFREFVGNLDQLHARVATAFPELRPPSFRVEDLDDGRMRIHYLSVREGLEPMLIGLLEGLADRFGIRVEIRSGTAGGHPAYDVTTMD